MPNQIFYKAYKSGLTLFIAFIHASILQNLLKSSTVAERCREFQKRMAVADPLPPLCEWAEEIARAK